MGTANLLFGDAKDIIKDIPDHSIDLILTDPPYNLNKYSTGNIKLKWRSDINNDIAEWDSVEFEPSEWADQFIRILKPSGNIFAFTAHNILGKWHNAFDPLFDSFQFMVWHKTNPVPKIYRAGFLNSIELIVCMWNKGHTWNFISQKDMHNFYESPICGGAERIQFPKHPTQKPVILLEHILRIASNEGDCIFDPFMGLGSTGVAALKNDRQFIGCEIDEEYFLAAKCRLDNIQPHMLSL